MTAEKTNRYLSKTLIVFLCEDRELGRNYQSIKSNLLDPLKADFTVFGVTNPRTRSLDGYARMDGWEFDEPADWSRAYEQIGLDLASQRKYVDLGEMFFGGLGLDGSLGSGAIIFYWRYLLGKQLISPTIQLDYEWYCITRSDFYWNAPVPPLSNLNEETVYFLDGEFHGGVSDRFVLFHRSNLENVAAACDRLIEYPELTYAELEGTEDLNPERFLSIEWQRLGVFNDVKFLPYVGYSVRSKDGVTRWSGGKWSKSEDAYVKYPAERRQARLFGVFIREKSDWGGYPLGSSSFRLLFAQMIWRIYSNIFRFGTFWMRALSKLRCKCFETAKKLSRRN